ncbi:hypothetical protein S83_010725 [Arachis hypogaea]
MLQRARVQWFTIHVWSEIETNEWGKRPGDGGGTDDMSTPATAVATGLGFMNARVHCFVLNGSIPEWFGDKSNNNYLGALQVLDLSSCSITGSIPESIGGLILLKSVLLSGNSLIGRMPSGLGMLSNLSVLDLSGNKQ